MMRKQLEELIIRYRRKVNELQEYKKENSSIAKIAIDCHISSLNVVIHDLYEVLNNES